MFCRAIVWVRSVDRVVGARSRMMAITESGIIFLVTSLAPYCWVGTEVIGQLITKVRACHLYPIALESAVCQNRAKLTKHSLDSIELKFLLFQIAFSQILLVWNGL